MGSGQGILNPLSALFQDFDWADEVHARVGRDWYVSTFEDLEAVLWRRMLEPSL